jgi:hypothetical protein
MVEAMEKSSPHHTAIGTRFRTPRHVQNIHCFDLLCGQAAGYERAWRAAALTRRSRCKWLKKWRNPARTAATSTRFGRHHHLAGPHHLHEQCGQAAGRNSERGARQHRPLKFEHPGFRNPEQYEHLTEAVGGLGGGSKRAREASPNRAWALASMDRSQAT